MLFLLYFMHISFLHKIVHFVFPDIYISFFRIYKKVVDIHILQFLEDLMVHIIMKWDMA